MKVLWTHNFNPAIPGSGVFMHNMVSELRGFGINIELLYLGSLNSIRSIYVAKNYLRSYSKKFDLVHSQFGSACGFVSSASRVPCVLSLRGSDWHCYIGSDLRESWHGLLANTLTRTSISSFKAIVTMSTRMSDSVRKYFPRIRIETIPDPVDTKVFAPISRSEARLQLFKSESIAPWVLFTTLSVANPIKRVHLALDAVRIASAYIPGLELKVASGIRHEEMPLFVNSCNLALCTSTHEGWPNALKESLSCGIPFVSTNVSDLHAIAAKYNSCHISPPHAPTLAEMIVKSLSSEPEKDLRDEVRTMTMKASCGRLIDLYTDLLNSN